MATYTVQLNYNASISLEVQANDEGEAYAKARDLAELAPINQFLLTSENRARIVDVR